MLIGIREIEEKYEVLKKLGEGGMGAVYLARHRLLEEQRVIKTIKPALGRDQDLQNRFLREARVAAKLRHPHIAAVHDFSFTEDGTAYIVMAHIEGENLRDVQRRGQRFRVEDVIDIAGQALDALGYLHSKSFVHRDISSDNLMLSRQGSKPWVTLIDLGLAKNLETSNWNTKTGMVVGKVRYISPEQLNSGMDGVVVDARSDLYSFGVVLYELLTGEYPITGDDDVSLIAGHLYREPRSFDETDPRQRIPDPMRSVVMRALAKTQDERWSSAAELAAALERCRSPEATVEIDAGRASGPQPASQSGDEPDGTEFDVRAHVTRAPVTRRVTDDDGRQTLPVDLEAETAPISERSLERVAAEAQAEQAPTVPAGSRRSVARGWRFVAVALALVAVAAAAYFLSGGGRERAVPIAWGDYHALVIGNDDYQQLRDLETAVADARDLADVLERQYGFQVTLLENATRSEIFNALFDLQSRLTLRDNLLVYYAGHGARVGSGYWQGTDSHPTQDTNWLSTDHDLRPIFDEMKARHVLVVADSCYAGYDSPAEEPRPPPASREELRQRHARLSRMVLTSGGNAPVIDRVGGRHSIFAEALLGVLRSNESPLGVDALFDQVRPQVEEAAESNAVEQSPTLQPIPYSSRDVGGEFFFVPTPSVS
ncbi:MAG: protein kinase [Thermoanaerobaculia bacterium]|nr:protein kinase [Thermoanaerobaculia bacterium]